MLMNQIYNNPTMPLRLIYEQEGKEIKKASIKGWTDLEALIKRSMNAEKPIWTILNKVLPSNFRCSRKATGEREAAPVDKKIQHKASSDGKKSKKTISDESPKVPKGESKKKKVKRTIDDLEDEPRQSSVKKLSTKRVMG
jgi:hypothetical protein